MLRTLVLIGTSVLVLLAGPSCSTPPQAPVAQPSNPSLTFSGTTRSTLRIATFNIQNLGTTKLAKPAIMRELASLIRKYDIIAVQEIDDRSLRTPSAFLAVINTLPGARYDVVVSPLSGTTASASQDEQYAFYYNKEKIVPVGESHLYPDPQDSFIREPFAAQFRPINSSESVVLLTVHTEATKDGAVREISALGESARWAAQTFTEELGVIVLGDFNAGATYLTPAQVQSIRTNFLPHLWVVPDNADTTITSNRDQAHDRIVVIGDQMPKRFTGNWGVDRTLTNKEVSDHLPVWADFWFTGKN